VGGCVKDAASGRAEGHMRTAETVQAGANAKEHAPVLRSAPPLLRRACCAPRLRSQRQGRVPTTQSGLGVPALVLLLGVLLLLLLLLRERGQRAALMLPPSRKQQVSAHTTLLRRPVCQALAAAAAVFDRLCL